MALFGATTSGFRMVSLFATLIFLALEPTFGAPTPHLGPGRPGAPFWAKRGPEKYNFVEGWVPHEVSQDCLRGEWFVCYPGNLWVHQFPPNPPREGLYRDFPQTRKFQGAPGPLGGLPIVLLWACGLLQGSVAWPQALCVKTLGTCTFSSASASRCCAPAPSI